MTSSRSRKRPSPAKRRERPARPARLPDTPARPPSLARRLAAPARATPQELFALALSWWTQGERFDIGRMAQTLGVSRATVFRWVGSRELLYGEVISSLFEAALARARSESQGAGPARIVDVTQRLMRLLVADEPLRRFVQQDTEYAMRVLMSKSSSVEQRCAASVRAALEEGVREGHIRPAMNLDALAYLIVRIGESFLYRDAITGDPPDIDSAVTAIRLLLTAEG
jgi:AcrR family transcriptional regulator